MQERITKKRKYIPQDRSYKTASDDSFAVSLCSLTPDEIAPGKEGQDSPTAGRLRPARIIPLIVFALIFVFSASMLIYTAYDHAQSSRISTTISTNLCSRKKTSQFRTALRKHPAVRCKPWQSAFFQGKPKSCFKQRKCRSLTVYSGYEGENQLFKGFQSWRCRIYHYKEHKNKLSDHAYNKQRLLPKSRLSRRSPALRIDLSRLQKLRRHSDQWKLLYIRSQSH